MKLVPILALICGSAAAQIGGRVVVDGAPPPSPAFITVHCDDGRTPWAGYTDKKGEFLANVSKRVQNLEFEWGSCQVKATLAGFTNAYADLSHIGRSVVLEMKPLVASPEGTVSAADAAATPAARTAYEHGVNALRSAKWPAAEREFRKALARSPEFAAAWNQLGLALQKQNRPDDAAAAYARALKIDPLLFSAAQRWAVLEAGRNRWQSVVDITGVAIHNPAPWPSLCFYNAVANFNLGRMLDAERSASEAVALDRNREVPRAEYVLGHLLALRGDRSGAIEHLSRYLNLLPNAADAGKVRSELEAARAAL